METGNEKNKDARSAKKNRQVCPQQKLRAIVALPLPGLTCDFFHLVGQGNFIFVREKSENLKILWLW